MKKIILLFVTAVLVSVAAHAQSTDAFGKGVSLLNVGVGVGSPFFSSGYTSSLPVNPSLSYEYGISDVISLGAQVSYASAKYESSLLGYSYSFKESATYFGARASYHLNKPLNIPSNFDVYGGASLGYVTASISDNQGFSATASSGLGFGLFAGGKYYFSKSTGVYAELGYQSLALLNVGVAFKF